MFNKSSNHHHHPFINSPNHQDFKGRITKSPSFFGLNHHHHNFSKSPNHHKIYTHFTISTTNFGLNHISPNTPWSPLIKNLLEPHGPCDIIMEPKGQQVNTSSSFCVHYGKISQNEGADVFQFEVNSGPNGLVG